MTSRYIRAVLPLTYSGLLLLAAALLLYAVSEGGRVVVFAVERMGVW